MKNPFEGGPLKRKNNFSTTVIQNKENENEKDMSSSMAPLDRRNSSCKKKKKRKKQTIQLHSKINTKLKKNLGTERDTIKDY